MMAHRRKHARKVYRIKKSIFSPLVNTNNIGTVSSTAQHGKNTISQNNTSKETKSKSDRKKKSDPDFAKTCNRKGKKGTKKKSTYKVSIP